VQWQVEPKPGSRHVLGIGPDEVAVAVVDGETAAATTARCTHVMDNGVRYEEAGQSAEPQAKSQIHILMVGEVFLIEAAGRQE